MTGLARNSRPTRCLGAVAVVGLTLAGCGDDRGSPSSASTSAPESRSPVDTIDVVPGSHLDLGFTDTPSAVREKRIRVLDDAIDAAVADPRFRWFEEAGWVVDAWRTAHAADPTRLALFGRLLASGQLGVGAAWVAPHGAMFPEYLDLLLVHHEWLRKDFSYVPSVAVLNDVPSYPETLVDAFARAGVRYLLIGANMAFTSPLPERLSKKPFYWRSSGGNRMLVWIDDDGYSDGCTEWGIDPACAKIENPWAFPAALTPLETMTLGVTTMLGRIAPVTDAVIVQDSRDNGDATFAKGLPDDADTWERATGTPRVVLTQPEAFFERIEQEYGADLPTYEGEWGGDWDAIRANSPVWTWRLREAMRRSRRAPPSVRTALATTQEHSQTLGPGWPGMLSEAQTIATATEIADSFARAVGPELRDATPPPLHVPRGPLGVAPWTEILAPMAPRVVAGPSGLGDFVWDPVELSGSKPTFGAEGVRMVLHTTLDRRTLPGESEGTVSAAIEIPLWGDGRNVRLASATSPSAMEDVWLRDEPPPFVVAPGGLVVFAPTATLRVKAPLVFSWALVPDATSAGVVWLRGLVVEQSTACVFTDGAAKLPYEQLYPGEPPVIDVDVEVEIAACTPPSHATARCHGHRADRDDGACRPACAEALPKADDPSSKESEAESKL